MRGAFGDIEFSVEGDYLILHTDMGDVMIGPEELEMLHDVIEGMLEGD